MLIHVAAVESEGPLTIKVTIAGQPLRAPWVGEPPRVDGEVDVEMDIGSPLRWGDTVAVDGVDVRLRDGPLLRGVVESQEAERLTLRIADGVTVEEIDGDSSELPPGTRVVLVADQVVLYPTYI
jgi:hypothetical protein